VNKFLRLLAGSILLIACDICAAEQSGAEITKKAASVKIILTHASKADGSEIGNVQVTYNDGAKARWTSRGNCSLARIAPDGTVGWTVNGPASRFSARGQRCNDTLVLCRKGKEVAIITSAMPYIEDWNFINEGRHIVLRTRGSHGPSEIELHSVASGKLVDSVKGYRDNLPIWAIPYKD
jgi:hypothetical protein